MSTYTRTITIATTLLLLAFAATLALGQTAPIVHNGAMDGPGGDRSDGKGQLITPDGWTPVNIDAGRGDRLSVEPSDRPGAGQCLHVKTSGSDAGVYQSISPLEKGRTYLVTAWVKRLSGAVAVEAYSLAWGPAVMRRVDDSSKGWTRLAIGLTPVDGGAHLYLVASPQADFLIDDVQIKPAEVQVGEPESLPYDFAGYWRYRVAVKQAAGGAAPRDVTVQAVTDGAGRVELSRTHPLKVPVTGAATAEMKLPLDAEGAFAIEVVDAATGEPLGGSPVVPLPGSPWDIRYPYKYALFASAGYQWPMRISVQHLDPTLLPRLLATAVITDNDGKELRTIAAKRAGTSLVLPLDGNGMAPGDYRLVVTVRDSKTSRKLHQGERPLRVLAPAAHEVVIAPDGQTLVDGKPFFPIGMYWVFADPAGWKPGPDRKVDQIKELREAGINALHTYAFEHDNAEDTDENAIAYLDMAQEYGFKVMMGIKRGWYQGEGLDLRAIAARVNKLKGHPALLCWTLWDEPNFDLATVPRVQAMYDAVNKTDPYHPAMPVFGGPSGQPFRESADINLFDCYPGKGNTGILPGVFKRAAEGLPEKPIWYAGQAFRSGTTDDTPVVTLEDMRLSWQYALQAGAKSIWWYSYGGDGKAWDSVRTTPEHWENVKLMNRKLAAKVGAK